MMRTLSTLAMLAAACTLAAPALAQPPTTLVVRAVTGADDLPVTGVRVGVTGCAPGPVPTELATGPDGAVTAVVAAGCYQVVIAEVPSGCSLEGAPDTRVLVAPGIAQTSTFRFHCA